MDSIIVRIGSTMDHTTDRTEKTRRRISLCKRLNSDYGPQDAIVRSPMWLRRWRWPSAKHGGTTDL